MKGRITAVGTGGPSPIGGRSGWRVTAALAGVLALSTAGAAGAGTPGATVGVLPLRPDFYMLTVGGVNVGLETGADGTVLVNTGPVSDAAALLAQVKRLSSQPLRFIIDTSADPQLTGGNAYLSTAGQSLMIGWRVLQQFDNNPAAITGHVFDIRAPIIARRGVLRQMISAHAPNLALPSETFTRRPYNLRINGQIVEVVGVAPAHSSADSVVRFDRSDVVVTGAIFDVTRFPVIDLQHGGSIQGEIEAVNEVMNRLVVASGPVVTNADGTLVVPLHGHVCNQPELLVYRDMLWAVRDRIAHLIAQGDSLARVEASDPTQGYNTRFGSSRGSRTTRDFVAAVYHSLMARRRAPRHGGQP